MLRINVKYHTGKSAAPQAALQESGALSERQQTGVHWNLLRSGGVPLLTKLLADGNAVRV